MECTTLGIIDERTIDSPTVRERGSRTLMIRAIALREEFGDVLAEGAKRAAERIGGGAERYAMHVKGQEMAVFEPRTQTNLALGYAYPVGPRFDICEHDWDYDVEVGWPHTMQGSRTLGILQRVPMGELSARKLRNYKALNTIWSGCDALDLNIYGHNGPRSFP